MQIKIKLTKTKNHLNKINLKYFYKFKITQSITYYFASEIVFTILI